MGIGSNETSIFKVAVISKFSPINASDAMAPWVSVTLLMGPLFADPRAGVTKFLKL